MKKEILALAIAAVVLGFFQDGSKQRKATNTDLQDPDATAFVDFLGMNVNTYLDGAAIPFARCGPRQQWIMADDTGAPQLDALGQPQLADAGADGWPLESALGAVFSGAYPFPEGNYLLAGPGDASLVGLGVEGFSGGSWQLGGAGQVSIWCPTGGRATLRLTGNDLDTQDTRFVGWWTEPLKGRTAVLRTMNWNNTNLAFSDQPRKRYEPDWDARTQVPDNWARAEGVPYEFHARAARAVGSHLWVCIPWDSDDAYLSGLAMLLRDEWDDYPRHIIVEYSNEVWNTLLPQGNLANAESPGAPGSAYGERAAVAFSQWEQEWRGSQIEFVLMGFTDGVEFIRDAVSAYEDAGGPELSALGCAAYVKPTPGGSYNSAEAVVEGLLVNLGRTVEGVSEHAAEASLRGLRTYVYEGGPSLQARNRSEAEWFPQAPFATNMKQAAMDIIIGCEDAGVDLFAAFNYVQQSNFVGNFGWWTDHQTPTEMWRAYEELPRRYSKQ